jgi:23S rRNA pseudouridine1911/1915/1917 synthase
MPAAEQEGCHCAYDRRVSQAGSSSTKGTSWVVAEDGTGTRLDKFLASPDRLGSRARVAAAIDRGKVFINDREAGRRDAGALLRRGTVVRVWMDRPGSAQRRVRRVEDSAIRIVHEDESLIVVDKPAGLLVVPLAERSDALSVYDYLKSHWRSRGKRSPLVVHRIDRDTSGLVLFAKTMRAQQQLKDQFERREPERTYLAILHGHPTPPQGTWRDHLVWDPDALVQKRAHPREVRGKEAISHFKVVEQFPTASLVEVRLETGKRNQIRIQARLHDHTLVGERLYAHADDAMRPIPFARQALHAFRLGFRHPVTGRPLAFEAPLPADMADLLTRLRRS